MCMHAVLSMHPCLILLQAQLEARSTEIAQLRHDMQQEVSEAAQQVGHCGCRRHQGEQSWQPAFA